MRWSRWAPGLLLVAIVSSCFVGPEAEVWDEPRYALSLYEAALRADLHREAGRHEESNRIAMELLAREPLFVPAHRLRQEHLRAHGHVAQAWDELARLRERFGESPVTHYLEGRLISPQAEQQKHFLLGWQRWPDSFWLKYAFHWSVARGVPSQLVQMPAGSLLEPLALDPRVPWPPIACLAFERHNGKRSKALTRRLEELRELFPFDGRISLVLAQTGGVRLDLLAEAIENGAAGESLVRAVAELPPGPRATLFDRIVEQPGLVARLTRIGGVLALADLALRCGHVRQAEEWLAEATEVAPGRSGRNYRTGPGQFTALPDDLLMPLLLDRGHLELAGIRLRARLNEAAELFDVRQLPARFPELFARDAAELFVPADGEAARRLLGDLERLGEGELVERLVPRLCARFPAARPVLEAAADDSQRFQHFFDAVVAMLSPSEAKGRAKLGRGLGAALDELRVLAKRHVGVDVVGAPDVIQFPLAGSFLDPFGPGLPAYFAEHGRYLLLGQLLGEPVGALIGRRMSERKLGQVPGLELARESREVLLWHKEFVSFQRLDTSTVAGLAIWHHFLLDARIARRWAEDVGERGERYGRLAGDARRSEGPLVAALCFDRPCQVDWRIHWKLRARRGWDARRVQREVLRSLRLHERAHLVDAQRYLPITQNLGSSFAFFMRAGFSFEGLLADLELRAECAALAYGANVELTLAQLADFHRGWLRGTKSQHARGFSELLRRLVRKWERDGAPGAEDPEKNLVSQVEAMPAENARRYAREVLAEEDFRTPLRLELVDAGVMGGR